MVSVARASAHTEDVKEMQQKVRLERSVIATRIVEIQPEHAVSGQNGVKCGGVRYSVMGWVVVVVVVVVVGGGGGGVWYVVCGVWCVVCGLWCVVCGVWCGGVCV